jgi:N6-adenosine-specific RNA methylase IME4
VTEVNELVLLNSATGEVQPFSAKATAVALNLPEELTYEQWLEYGSGLNRMSQAAMWWLGDWWAFGEQNYGERAAAADGMEWSFKTCANAGTIARKIETSRRREVLSWQHHAEVAALGVDDQEELLDRWERQTVDTGKPPTVREVRTDVKNLRRDKRRPQIEDPAEPVTSAGPFDVIYSDPPWRYEFAESDNRAIENHYPTMDLQDICDLRPPAFDNAVLFLWATATKIDEALEVMAAWGFTYKTSMVWVKDKIGMGYYVRNQHELLLIGKRGEIPVPEPENRPSSVLNASRGVHSKKPDEFYDLIERMYPGRAYAEIFARQTRPNWFSWGNQV